jgi:hypothetical protein
MIWLYNIASYEVIVGECREFSGETRYNRIDN